MGIIARAIAILNQVNVAVASGIVLTTFSLLIYILSHNLRSSVARAFSLLLGFMTLVYGADVMVVRAEGMASAVFWLKFQWLGIAFVPAAYLHLSDSLLRVTNLASPWRRAAVAAGYGTGLFTLAAVLFSELIVSGAALTSQAAGLTAGPLFSIFAVYFFATTLVGALNIQRARKRALTSTMRRRLTYLTLACVAPALGAFPYLLVASLPSRPGLDVLLAGLLFIGNIAVALMLIVMAYSVAFFGVLAPDRVVKQSLIHYLLRGPLVGSLVLAIMLLMPKTEHVLGLRRDTVLALFVVMTVVGMQILINVSRPFIDRLIYRQDSAEIAWIQELNNRLLTTTDLRQFLENVLTGICEQLRVEAGFLARRTDHQFQVEVGCGVHRDALGWVESFAPEAWPQPTAVTPGGDARVSLGAESLIAHEGYWILPLRSGDRQSVLGLLGLRASPDGSPISSADLAVVGGLVATAETALEDRHLQQGVFETLRQIIPHIDMIQQIRGASTYGVFGAGRPLLADVSDPGFLRAVREALSHYWGGSRLTTTPLLQLGVAQQALREADGNPARGMRAMLTHAIECLKPDSERTLSSSDWLLYNILELKFVQGRKMREIASRLSLSESDLYRKQRVAVEEVARQLARMESSLH